MPPVFASRFKFKFCQHFVDVHTGEVWGEHFGPFKRIAVFALLFVALLDLCLLGISLRHCGQRLTGGWLTGSSSESVMRCWNGLLPAFREAIADELAVAIVSFGALRLVCTKYLAVERSKWKGGARACRSFVLDVGGGFGHAVPHPDLVDQAAHRFNFAI